MMQDAKDLEAWANLFVVLALQAGEAVMAVRSAGFKVRNKPDRSPVSEADEAAEKIILAGLRAHGTSIPVVAEESVSSGFSPVRSSSCLLVDPLDGTREFISGRDEFTVNIALVEEGAPICGVVYAPALSLLWLGASSGETRWARRSQIRSGAHRIDDSDWTALCARKTPTQGWTALVSRSHLDDRTERLIENWPIVQRLEIGSSLKFCKIAEGEADVYPRCGPTMEWDTAAGDAVLRGAGGMVLDEAGTPLRYGKKDWRNGAFVAWGREKPSTSF